MSRPSALADEELLRIDNEPPGEHCALGGTAKHTGADISGDGILQDDEIFSTLYTCNCAGALEPSVGDVMPPVCEPPTLLHTRFESDGDTLYSAIQGVRASLLALAPVPDAGRHALRAAAADDECLLGRVPRSRVSSQRCLQCHTNRGEHPLSTGRLQLHPVGVDYDDAVKRGHLGLHPVDQLPMTVVLVDGRVECTTCHSKRSNLRSRLATQRLCFACHRR